MKKFGVLFLLMLAAGPVTAQDEAAATPGFGTDEPVAESTDATAADSTAAETTPPADAAADAATDDSVTAAEAAPESAADTAAEAPAESPTDTATDTAAETPADAGAEAVVVEETVEVEEVTEVAEAEEAPADTAEAESDPWELYVGTDYVWTQARFSKDSLKTEFGGDDFDSSMVRARLGVRLFQKIGVEVHIGAGNDDVGDLEADEYSTEEFYGAYLVPTGVLFDLFEVGAAIGVAQTKLETATGSETLSGVSFGVNLEVPVYTSDAVELRLGGGGTMFRAQNSAQIAGYFAGLRVDFRI
ncbi:MAG TPA: hypothetical protein VGE51_02345 [Fontimonas sp.]